MTETMPSDLNKEEQALWRAGQKRKTIVQKVVGNTPAGEDGKEIKDAPVVETMPSDLNKEEQELWRASQKRKSSVRETVEDTAVN